MLGNEVVLVIVGNKTDLEKDRTVDSQEAEDYATSVGAKYFETSAKMNEGIEDVFLDLSAAVSLFNPFYLYFKFILEILTFHRNVIIELLCC